MVRGVLFLGIHADRDATVEVVRHHADEYALPFPVMIDREQILMRRPARVTPEAVVLWPDGQVFYRGRIDDRYAARWPRSTGTSITRTA